MTGNFVTIDHIIESLNRSPLPGMSYNPDELKEWTWEALSFIGTKNQNIDVSKILEIKEGKAILPKDIQEFGNVIEYETGYPLDEINLDSEFALYTYKLNNGYIYTDFQTGTIQLNYFAFPISDEGIILIPDNIYFIKAVVSYLKFQIGTKLFWQNKILKNQLDMLEKDWYYYINGAKNSTKVMSTDRLYDFRKKFLTMMPDFKNRVRVYNSEVLINQTTI